MRREREQKREQVYSGGVGRAEEVCALCEGECESRSRECCLLLLAEDGIGVCVRAPSGQYNKQPSRVCDGGGWSSGGLLVVFCLVCTKFIRCITYSSFGGGLGGGGAGTYGPLGLDIFVIGFSFWISDMYGERSCALRCSSAVDT